MKIECDKCSAKYSIADEKVRGKTFKIRCKKCSNVIIVRDKVAAAAGGGGGVDIAVDQTAPGWHLAINGETVGPMSEDEVRQRYDAGEIDKDTAIWQEGFEDWIPLGDVEGFADLPDRAIAAAGDDPFASANQDDYAAARMAAPAAAVGVAPMSSYQPQAQVQSPRVSSLTGQRNENSVLFSLDSLQALATGGGGAAAAPAASSRIVHANPRVGTKGLATAAPGSEGSGLIDIRALGAMVGDDRGGHHGGVSSTPAADDTALPSFGGAGLGGLAAAPLVAHSIEPAAAAAMAQPPARSNAPLYAMMAILILAVVGLGVYIVLKPTPEPVVVTQENPEAPSVKAAGADEEDEDDDKDKKKSKDDEGEADEEGEKDEGEAAAEAGEEEGDAAEGGELADATDAKGKTKSSSSKTKGKTKTGSSKDPLSDFPSTSSSSSTKSSSSSSSSSKGGDVDVDCILDPKACGKGKSSSSSSSSSSKPSTSSGSSDPSLPEKLSTTDIRDGVTPVKGAAKACGGKHGAKPGEKVKVKLSISGATGAVTAATAEAPHTGTPLGNCVAAALKKARFKKFQKASLGAVYPVSM